MGLVYMLVSFTNAIHVSFILIKYVLPGFRQKNLPIIKHLPAKPRREIYHANKDSHSFFFPSRIFTLFVYKKLHTSLKPRCSRSATKLRRAGIENCIKLAVPTTEENLRQQWRTDKNIVQSVL